MNELGLILGGHEAQTLAEGRSIFEVFAKHNQITPFYLDLIRKLLDNGDWLKVTPLKPYESLPMRYQALVPPSMG